MDQVHELSDALPLPKIPSFHVEINQCGYSTVPQQLIKEAVGKFLFMAQGIHGDTSFTEFADEFLKEHVKSISVISDTDYFSKYGQDDVYAGHKPQLTTLYPLHVVTGPGHEYHTRWFIQVLPMLKSDMDRAWETSP